MWVDLTLAFHMHMCVGEAIQQNKKKEKTKKGIHKTEMHVYRED